MSRPSGRRRYQTAVDVISPSVISSRPAIIRRVVDLPQPEGAYQHDELLIGDLKTKVLDGDHAFRSYLQGRLFSSSTASSLFFALFLFGFASHVGIDLLDIL